MICSACGTENEAGRKFCKECGSALALVCPSCGSANAPDSKFCGECGSPLAPGSAVARPPSAATTTTERRLVCVLFADLVGSTSLAEHRDAEDTRDLLNRYFDVAREAIERHGGLVEKFIGDAVMAVWGTPLAHEDDSERAVRSALEILDAVEALGRTAGLPLRARAGVLTGEAAAVVGDVSQGIVAGDMVNTASRLEAAAEPGTVLVGEATFRAAARAITFEEVGQLSLKGRAEPVRAWRALRVVGQRGGEGRSSGLEPPFVGRTEELRLIKELLHATGREGKARLVSVTGIGGIGKSRLAWEFLKYVDGLTETVYWHQGRCPAYGDGVSFWALGEMVRMRARIAETDSPEESHGKLKATVEEHVKDVDERRWIEPRLAHLLGLEDRPSGEREELFSAWRTFFERISGQGTVALVFEDLQWADPGLLDFVESLLEWSRNHPILIVTLSRPELADRRPGWGADQRNFSSLRLEPLPADAMAELVKGFVQGLPDGGVARIVERAEGVPLYAVETVRMLADRGALEQGEDVYRVIGEFGDLDIPETLQALIAARLDALPAEDRTLLQEGSVLGKSFTVAGLGAVANLEDASLEPRLRDLVRKEFLEQETDPRSPERGQYTFLQGLIREVAYGTLSRQDRRRLHLSAAHHVESLGDDELAGVVAAHYVEAFRATPEGPDADALAARARDWLGQAAQRATSLGSPEQALGFAEQALAITPGGPERAALLEQAAEAAEAALRHEAVVRYHEEAIVVFHEAGDIASAGRATARMSRSLGALERRPEAITRMEEALATLGDEGEDAARAALLAALAGMTILIGENDRSIDYIERALPLLERLDRPDELGDAITTKAFWMMRAGRHREAAMLFNGALALADEIGDRKARADALLMLGIVELEDDPERSLRYWSDSTDAARRAGVRGIELLAIGNMAELAIDLGRWDRADEVLRDLGARPDLPTFNRRSYLLSASLLAACRGDIEEADSIMSEDEAGLQATDHVMERTWYLRVRATIALMAGDLLAAYGTGMQSIELEPSGGNAPNSAWTAARAALWLRDPDRALAARSAMDGLRGRWVENARRVVDAGIAALEGRIEESVTTYLRAWETWEAMNLPLARATSTVDAAMLLPLQNVPSEAVAWARGYLKELGAAPLLERLETAQADAAQAAR